MIYCKSLHNIDESTLNGTFKGSAVPAYRAFDAIGGGDWPAFKRTRYQTNNNEKEVINHH